MKEFFSKIIDFIKNNPGIMYSLVLLILIPFLVFVNTFYILKNFQKNIDNITHSKVILAQDIINSTAQDYLTDPQKLGELINKTMAQNEEIRQFEFLGINQEKGSFKVIASSEKLNIGKDTAEVQNILAWNREEGIAFLGNDGKDRVWKITKMLKDDQGEKIGLVSLAISLNYSDELIDSTINKSYLVLLISIFVIFLLIINNMRLFGYALSLYKIREVDKMKDNFISMASHELRSPLSAIKGYLELLDAKNKGKLETESLKYLTNMNSSVDRLDVLVTDILEISRIEGNRIPFEISAFNPSDVIQKAIEEMRVKASQKNLALECSISNLPEVKADRERLEQILINLLNNAIKYTIKGKVEVLAKTKGKEFLITVADTGIGISSEDMANLFQKFYRVENEELKSVVGTGLGLWIARELARKMNGDITAESIREVGSHFTLHLPLA